MKQLGASSLAPQHHWDSRISGPSLLLLAWKRLGEMKQLGASSLATQHNWDSCITATTLMPPIRWRWTGRRRKLSSVDGAPKSHVVFCRKLGPRGRTIYRWIISAGPQVPSDQITGSICGIKSHCGCPSIVIWYRRQRTNTGGLLLRLLRMLETRRPPNCYT